MRASGVYVVERRLGAGGMGLVVAAHDPQLERAVAIKVLLDGGMGHDAPHHRVRMQREAQALAAVSHPNVVTVLDVGEVEGQVFIAMELVEGQTLAHWLAAAPRAWRQILAVYRYAGRGLEAVHAAGLVHRDFKPANVLVGSDGRVRVRVTDFGVVGIEATSPSFPPAPMPSHGDDDVSRGITRQAPSSARPRTWLPSRPPGCLPIRAPTSSASASRSTRGCQETQARAVHLLHGLRCRSPGPRSSQGVIRSFLDPEA